MVKKNVQNILTELQDLKHNFLSKVAEIEELSLSKNESNQADKIIQEVVTHSRIALDELTL